MVLASWSPKWNFLNMLFPMLLYSYAFSLPPSTASCDLGFLANTDSYSVCTAPEFGGQPGGTTLLADSALVPCVALWGLDSLVLGESRVALAPEGRADGDAGGGKRGTKEEWRGEVWG